MARETQTTEGMKVTTVRFGEDLWALLESEAERAGVSVSQYIREAALARAAFAAGSRAEAPSELLARWVQSTVEPGPLGARNLADTERLIAALGRRLAREHRQDSRALVGEGRQAQRRAKAAMDGSKRTES
jgi:mobilization protein NikA